MISEDFIMVLEPVHQMKLYEFLYSAFLHIFSNELCTKVRN
jgi:hypothetical protein